MFVFTIIFRETSSENSFRSLPAALRPFLVALRPMPTAIKIENVSKLYRLGTGTIVGRPDEPLVPPPDPIGFRISRMLPEVDDPAPDHFLKARRQM